MKILKWNILTDNELEIIIHNLNTATANGLLKREIEYFKKINWEQYNKIEQLEKENEWLKNNQKIEIVNLNNG